jgi:hypothetical protein
VAALTGISSGNGPLAAGLGMFPASLAGCVLACRACEEALGSFRSKLGFLGLAAPLAIADVLARLVTNPVSIYRDAPLDRLTTTVRSGPYRDLRTTAEKASYVAGVHSDIVANHTAGEVLFFPDFSMGYLSAQARGAIPEVWASASGKRLGTDAQVFREHARNVPLVMTRWCPGGAGDHYRGCAPQPGDWKSNLLFQALAETHEVVTMRSNYAIYKLRAP